MTMTAFADRLRAFLRVPSQAEPPHPFDRAYGVDTSGLYYPDRLPSGHPHDRYSEGYYATAPSLFHAVAAQWQATLPPGLGVRDYSFIDLGCGKGRVLLLASGYPFHSVTGLELNPRLARIARRNLRRYVRSRPGQSPGYAPCGDAGSGATGRPPVAVEAMDVLNVRLPDGPVVLFLFNSFAEEIVRALMEKLAAAGQSRLAESRAGVGKAAPIDLLYVHPDHDALVAQTPGIELLRCAEIPFSYEDFQADIFGVSSDVCSMYRLAFSSRIEAPRLEGDSSK